MSFQKLDPITLVPSETGVLYKVTVTNEGYIIKEKAEDEPMPLTLDEVKAQKKSELLQTYYGSFTTFQSSATGTLKTYPCDAEAQQNLKDLEQRLIADPNKDSFWFKTIEDGTLINHTRVQFLQLMEDAETFKVQQTIKYNDKIKQVDLSTTEAEVNTIVW